MKICVISEDLRPPFDKGEKNFVWQLARALRRRYETLVISRLGSGTGELPVAEISTNKLLMSQRLMQEIRRFAPRIVYYIPHNSATLASFARAKLLSRYAKEAKFVMIALQPRSYPFWVRRLLPNLLPDLILAVEGETLLALHYWVSHQGCLRCIAPGVDLERFCPLHPAEKRVLRAHYGFSEQDRIVLHVGHLRPERNVHLLPQIRDACHAEVVLVASSSTPPDSKLQRHLEAGGVLVIRRYLPAIQELYQIADCYLFPTQESSASIGVPLSVLEAMACNLPVVTTPFGGLPQLFCEGAGLIYARSESELLSGVQRALGGEVKPQTRRLVQPYCWELAAQEIVRTSLLCLIKGLGVLNSGRRDNHGQRQKAGAQLVAIQRTSGAAGRDPAVGGEPEGLAAGAEAAEPRQARPPLRLSPQPVLGHAARRVCPTANWKGWLARTSSSYPHFGRVLATS